MGGDIKVTTVDVVLAIPAVLVGVVLLVEDIVMSCDEPLLALLLLLSFS